MNQRLLAWHGMKAGMDDERKEGRRWAEGGGGERGKRWRDAMVRGFFHLLSLSLDPSVHDIGQLFLFSIRYLSSSSLSPLCGGGGLLFEVKLLY